MHALGPDTAFGLEFLVPSYLLSPHSLFLSTKKLHPVVEAHFAWHAEASPTKLLIGFPKFCPEYSTPFSKQSVTAANQIAQNYIKFGNQLIFVIFIHKDLIFW